MKHEFWHERWEKQEIGFHLADTNPALAAHWQTIPVDLGERVLVPLCGKSVDILWLLREGYQVVGVELSEVALDAMAESIEETFSLAVDKQKVGDYILYRAAGILLICGDWFAMTSYDTGPIDAVYDRAALIAMPEDLRRQYSEQLRAVAGNAPQLLVTLEYDQSEMAGPPFSVPVDQVESYYGDVMNIDLIADKDCLIDEPKFRERGLSSLRERVVRLTPKV
ncbi:thiopurine S-methyltransferase [Thalassolituus maritimus]|uniref:Thiopurine S-methyltransferase n=1 Tax=Thalassolituus maritimus TaxID=484498 RepID=A0ABP9ZVK7_9GAMM